MAILIKDLIRHRLGEAQAELDSIWQAYIEQGDVQQLMDENGYLLAVDLHGQLSKGEVEGLATAGRLDTASDSHINEVAVDNIVEYFLFRLYQQLNGSSDLQLNPFLLHFVSQYQKTPWLRPILMIILEGHGDNVKNLQLEVLLTQAREITSDSDCWTCDLFIRRHRLWIQTALKTQGMNDIEIRELLGIEPSSFDLRIQAVSQLQAIQTAHIHSEFVNSIIETAVETLVEDAPNVESSDILIDQFMDDLLPGFAQQLKQSGEMVFESLLAHSLSYEGPENLSKLRRKIINLITRLPLRHSSVDFVHRIVMHNLLNSDEARVVIYEAVLFWLGQAQATEPSGTDAQSNDLSIQNLDMVRLVCVFVKSLAEIGILRPIQYYEMLFGSFVKWIGLLDEARIVYMLGQNQHEASVDDTAREPIQGRLWA